jgi:hypothetical protein
MASQIPTASNKPSDSTKSTESISESQFQTLLKAIADSGVAIKQEIIETVRKGNEEFKKEVRETLASKTFNKPRRSFANPAFSDPEDEDKRKVKDED